MISTIKNLIKNLFIPKFEYQEKVECAIDEDVVECSEMDTPPYTGIPAPVVPPSDSWFQDPPRTQKQEDYMEMETEIKKENQGKEDPDIHQKMYEIATKNWTTVKETKGWQSGTGYGQFRVDT